MAMNIDNFSFDPWPQGRVIGGSGKPPLYVFSPARLTLKYWALFAVGSVLVTLLLCILGWRIYEVTGAADAEENRERIFKKEKVI